MKLLIVIFLAKENLVCHYVSDRKVTIDFCILTGKIMILKTYHFLLKHWFRLDRKIRFLLVGGFNTSFSYLLFVIFSFILGVKYFQQALFLSWLSSSVVSFVTQKFYVFRTSGNYVREYFSCLISWSVVYLINALLLEYFHRVLLWNLYLSQALSVCIYTVITYLLFKYFAFRKKTA